VRFGRCFNDDRAAAGARNSYTLIVEKPATWFRSDQLFLFLEGSSTERPAHSDGIALAGNKRLLPMVHEALLPARFGG
jgi:hypothetical protein